MTAILAKPTRGKPRAHYTDIDTCGANTTLCGRLVLRVEAYHDFCTTAADLYEFASNCHALVCKLCAARALKEVSK